MLEGFIQSLLDSLLVLGYPGIIALMTMESSVLPVPSELVMPPAGYWAARGEMNFILAVACGTLGSILGALVNYFGSQWLGRPFIERFGKYVLLTPKALAASERFFAAHGEISTLIGRLIPVVRHLISVPAGIHRMPLPKFIAYTGLGAAVWCTILTWIGYVLGRNEGVLRNEEVRQYVSRALWIMVPVLVAVVGVYVWRRRKRATP